MKWGIRDMKSQTSLFNKGLFSSVIKRYWWISFLYFATQFVTLPMVLMLKKPDYIQQYSRNYDLSRAFSNTAMFTIALLYIVPIFLAVFIMRYLQTTKSATMIHSMPFTRGQILFNMTLSGFLLFSAPILLNALALLYVKNVSGLSFLFKQGDILYWLGFSILMGFLNYMICVFVGMFSGSSVAQGILTYIFNLLPFAFYLIYVYFCDYFLYGFEAYFDESIFSWLPFVKITEFYTGRFTWVEVTCYILAIIVFYMLSYIAYKYRKLEWAQEIITFPFMRQIFKYGFTFCVSTFGTMYIMEMKGDSYIWVSLILWALLGYVAAEMMLRKSFKVFDSYKGFLGYVLAMALVVAFIEFDIIGFEKRVPKPDDVARIYYNDSIYTVRIKEAGKYDYDILDMETKIEGRENIEAIINYHKEIIKNRDPEDETTKHDTIIYILKNGRMMARSYRVDYEKYLEIIKPLLESEEYKKNIYPVYRDIDPSYITEITLSLNDGSSYTLHNTTLISEIIFAAKEQIAGYSYKDVGLNPSGNYISVRFEHLKKDNKTGRIKEHRTTLMDVYSKSDPLYKYFEEKGLLENVMQELTGIDEIRYEIYNQVTNETKETVVKDKDEIEKIIKEIFDLHENRVYYNYNNVKEPTNKRIYITFRKGGKIIRDYTEYFYENELPSFIK